MPQIPNVVTLRFGMQSCYTSAEYPQSGFFAAFEVDLSRLVSRVEGPAPPCGSSGTVFKKQLNGHLTGACRVDGIKGMRFKVDGVYDAMKIVTRGRAPKGEESKPLKLSLFANHGSFVASLRAPGGSIPAVLAATVMPQLVTGLLVLGMLRTGLSAAAKKAVARLVPAGRLNSLAGMVRVLLVNLSASAWVMGMHPARLLEAAASLKR